MRYTKSDALRILHETEEEKKLKEYFNSLESLGEDFACRSFIIKPDIIESMSLFTTDKSFSSSDEIVIYMIKGTLLTYNKSESIVRIKELMLSGKPLNTIIDSILINQEIKMELARNLFYLRDINSMEMFEELYKDDKEKERILDSINRLNTYIDDKQKEKKEHRISELPTKHKKYYISSKKLKKIA